MKRLTAGTAASKPRDRARLRPCFVVGSLLLHAFLFVALLHTGTAQHGFAQVKSDAAMTRKLNISLYPEIAAPAAPAIRPAFDVLPATKPDLAAAASPEQPAAHEGIPVAEAPSIPAPEFLPAGRLTRLPSPAHPVDLNVAGIATVPYQGRIRLLLRIDAAGMVAEAVPEFESDDAREFAAAVAARFRDVRFVPGEIDGVPVPAQIGIEVVSEAPTAPAPLPPKRAPEAVPDARPAIP